MIETKMVLHVTPTMGYGGVASMLMNYYKKVDSDRVQFDFITHGNKEDYHEVIKNMGGKVFYINTLGKIGVVSYIKTIKKIIRENGPYDAVHIHTNYQAGIVAFAAKLARVKLRVCHVHGSYIGNKKIEKILPLLKAFIKFNCNKLLACSIETGKFYYGNSQFEVIPNAVDLHEYMIINDSEVNCLRKSLNISDNTIILGHVGRFSYEKNHIFLLKLLKQIVENGEDCCLVMAGDGELRTEIQNIAKSMGLESYTRFLGQRDDVPRLMKMFNVLLLPSISEGLPNVIVQAQAAGTFCVVSDIIAKEVDMGLNMIEYAPLNDIYKWEACVKSQIKRERINQDTISNRIKQNGFEINSAVDNFIKLYFFN